MMRKVMLAALVAFITTPCSAGFYDGNKMNENCKKAEYFVLGYVSGAFDTMETAQAAMLQTWIAGIDPKTFASPLPGFDQAYADNSAPLGNYCAPKGAVLKQVSDIFCQYLAATPGERQEPANVLLARALSKAWPCQMPKKR